MHTMGHQTERKGTRFCSKDSLAEEIVEAVDVHDPQEPAQQEAKL